MEYGLYLNIFTKAIAALDKTLLAEKKIETEVGIWLDSAVLRMQKKSWANAPFERPQTKAAIFFSIWANDKTLKENKVMYNIHALKLRQLKGYAATGIAFAAAFRQRLKPFEDQWPNISTAFGPLTLMQGWINADEALDKNIEQLAANFLQLDALIDELLESTRRVVR